jgi:DNA-binding CsgD family transcriptional regulator
MDLIERPRDTVQIPRGAPWLCPVARQTGAVQDWPLVGRAAALERVHDLLVGPEPRCVVLAGPSGVGKTALGRACLRLARDEGATTHQVTATRSAARLPFGAVAPLLHDAAPDLGPAKAVDDRVDLLRRSVAALADRSDGSDLLLFVDDAHLLDDASATLVHQVAASGAATVLATVTSGEVAPDPVVALWKDELAERVELDGLAADAITELLSAVVGGPIDSATAAQFTERCQGNALFLRELVVGALDDGSLVDEGGIWRLVDDLSRSARLVEIVETRLGRLDDDERALLELVAYGEPLGQAELAALSDHEVAEALERRGLLASHLDDRRMEIRLAHPLYGDVVRARTPALRARGIAESLADAVEGTGSARHEDALRIATWRLTAGDGDPQVLLDGATTARWRYDFPLAERLARAAADAGAGFDAELLAAHITGLQGRSDEAAAELADLAERAGTDAERARVAIVRFDTSVVWSAADESDVLGTALAAVGDPAWRDRLAARRLAVVLNAAGPRAAIEAARPVLAAADGEALVFALLAEAYGLARAGRLDEALTASDRGADARLAIDSPLAWYPWWHAVPRCMALLYAGRFQEAAAEAGGHHGQAVAEGSAEAQAIFAVLEATAAADRGQVRTAAHRAREAQAVHQNLRRPVLVRQDLIVGALAHALSGDAAAATAQLDELDALGLPPVLRDEVDLIQARAWTAAAAGDMPTARAHLEAAADMGREIGDRVGEAAALHALARLGRARDVRTRLVEVAAGIDGDLATARVAHTEALVTGDTAALDEVSLRFDEMGADLLAAEAAADAAVGYRQAGDLRAAAAAERRAAELAERAEGPVTPALQAIETRARLTPAERETAVLAAAGRTNKEIAEQLHLSPRTIENRLQRVYEKLGISGRAELQAVLAPDE